MLNRFEYYNNVLNEIERNAIQNIDPPRMIGYRLGYITAHIEHDYFNDVLLQDEYRRLIERSEEIYLEVKR